MQSWGRVFKITLRLAPVRLFQTVSRLSRIFQQQKFTSLAFRVIAYCVSKIMSRCFRVCNFRVCNFRGCNFLRLSSFGLPSRPLTRGIGLAVTKQTPTVTKGHLQSLNSTYSHPTAPLQFFCQKLYF